MARLRVHSFARDAPRRGVRLWDGLEGIEERFAIESVASPSGVVHRLFTRRSR